eukprot:12929281-Prorocentrum_lima.AAC.1
MYDAAVSLHRLHAGVSERRGNRHRRLNCSHGTLTLVDPSKQTRTQRRHRWVRVRGWLGGWVAGRG